MTRHSGKTWVLELGEVSQEVTVQAEVLALGTENPAIGEVISDEQIVELPLNGRSFVQLANLSAGITSPGNAQGKTNVSVFGRSTSSISISGQREFSTDYRFDGIPAKDRIYGPVGMQFDVDAISEFKVQRGYASSDIGLSGRIDVITKSGTNDFHGSAWEFLRNEKLDARNTFANAKLPLRQNQFGAAAGGPLIKNKLFYFGDYEGLRIRSSSPSLGRIPTVENLQGNFAGGPPVVDPAARQPFPGNIIPSNRISTFAAQYNKFIPQPNASGAINRVISTRTIQDEDKYNGRVDYTISSSDTVFGRYTHVNSRVTREGFIPLTGIDSPLSARNAVAGWTHFFAPNMLNSFRFGLNRVDNNPFIPEGAKENPSFKQMFGLQNLNELPECNGLPGVNMAGYNGLGAGTLCLSEHTNDLHFIDDFSYTRGRHRLSTGFEIIRVRMRQIIGLGNVGSFAFSGQYTGNPVADYLLGNPNSASGQNFTKIPYRKGIWPSFYINDNVRLTSKLNLTVGLRYEYIQPLADKERSLVSFDPTVPGGGYLFEEGSGLGDIGRLVNPGLLPPDKNNWAPRFGLAYSPGKDVALRASYGIFYQEPIGNNLNAQQNGPPYRAQVTLLGELNNPTINLGKDLIFPLLRPPYRGPSVGVFGLDFTYRTPYLQSWTLSIQKTLPAGLLAEGAYVGSKGTKLDKWVDLNIAATPPPPGFTGTLQSRRAFPDFGTVLFIAGSAKSNYHGLQLTLKKSWGGGLSFLTNYTFSKSLDTDSWDGVRSYILSDPGKARSSFDQRQRFTLSWVYQLPVRTLDNKVARTLIAGWQITGITLLQSGFPFAPVTAVDYSNRLLTYAPRIPIRTCNGNLPADERKPERWIETSCFSLPAQNTLGNSGLNILETDGVINQDFGLMKNFQLAERLRMQFRFEAFNLLNHANYRAPINSLENPSFGRVLGALPSRNLQFGLKFNW
ncbi:MAG: TonB-dependent receptor [Acidobacteria bacterium]|nr:TonB-dependent receptor [Acidobacteriota bacterium]MCI0722066.1 TonB-dependent receptor [Acidobacteriota bacterium]